MNNLPAAPTVAQAKEPLKPAHGIVLSLIISISAELLLCHFVQDLNYFSSISRVLIVFLGLYLVHSFALRALNYYRPFLKDLITTSIILLGSIVFIWFGRVLGISLGQYLSQTGYMSELSYESLAFAIPFATGGILIQALLGLQYGLVFAVGLSIIVGVYFPDQPLLVPYALATTMVACLSLENLRSRSAFLKAGLNVSLIAFPFALASIVMAGDVAAADIGARLFGALLSGVLCSFIAAGLTPVFEYLGGYVTDMRLIEMATLDHPLLKELSIQAPGTWNHSMVMGMMVEAAADRIGVNPVLARVGAYFHDIGKMKKPLYFVENQTPGENRHDKLSTSMSALIIRSHVKDGIELARKHKVPQPIIDAIAEHHGTSLIEFFYHKAKKEAEEADGEGAEVDQSLYSYPGPKPQSRATGLLMLADGIEAATRTLADPTHDRIQGLVQKMINKVFASGQLNDCELTLKDLHQIAACFTRVLTGIYHQRIQYAEPAEKVSEKSANQKEARGKTKAKSKAKEARKDNSTQKTQEPGDAKELDGGDSAKRSKGKSKNGKPAESDEEDLKRLGI